MIDLLTTKVVDFFGDWLEFKIDINLLSSVHWGLCTVWLAIPHISVLLNNYPWNLQECTSIPQFMNLI
jgi:hypothetical protein